MLNSRNGKVVLAALLAINLAVVAPAADGKLKELKPGLNFFSKQQDVQLGKEAAAQVQKQMQVVNNPQLEAYVQRVASKLWSQPKAGDYPYSIKVVNDPSINAFALPGGPMFIHTGLIAAAENEAQIAGVLAHEISHVALRHGTHQASKAQLIQLPAMLAGAPFVPFQFARNPGLTLPPAGSVAFQLMFTALTLAPLWL